MPLAAGEPEAGPWRGASAADVVGLLRAAAGEQAGRPVIAAVDGRSAGGKSTLAGLLHAAAPTSAVVHTDDVARDHSFFAWDGLLAAGVLEPVRRGEPVSYRPPAWDEHGHVGAIEVPTDLDLLIVEGVGAGRRSLVPWLDAVVWIQSDTVEAERRGIARDIELGVNGNARESIAFWHLWMTQELPFLAEEQPWRRAHVVVAGTPATVPPPGHVLMADGPLR